MSSSMPASAPDSSSSRRASRSVSGSSTRRARRTWFSTTSWRRPAPAS